MATVKKIALRKHDFTPPPWLPNFLHAGILAQMYKMRFRIEVPLNISPNLGSLAGSVQLEVRLMPGSQSFEVSGNGNLAVSGK